MALGIDEATPVANKVFKDAEAFVFHNRNVADLVPELFDAGPLVHLDVIGEPSEAMIAELGQRELLPENRDLFIRKK